MDQFNDERLRAVASPVYCARFAAGDSHEAAVVAAASAVRIGLDTDRLIISGLDVAALHARLRALLT